MYVSMETLRRAVRLAGVLAELDDPADFAPVVLPALAELVGCDVLTYNEIGTVPGRIRYVDYPAGVLDPATQPVFAAYVHQHPLVGYYRTTGDGKPVKISDFLGRQQFHRLGLYGEFFRAIPVEHQIAISLPVSARQVVGIAFSRAHTDFTESDRALLSILRAPLMTALLRTHSREPVGHADVVTTQSGSGGLTCRETEILELVATGRTDDAIARQLGVSPRTIAKHLEHIYRKLGVANRAAAVSCLHGRCPDCHERCPDYRAILD
jgi:DNA-binding CsgD family transcriptional regulator